jgi:hypothetical protein
MKEIGMDKIGAAAIKAYPDNENVVRYGSEILLHTYYTDEASRASLLAASAIDASGRVLKIDSVEARTEAWIPDHLVKLNEWFTAGGDDEDEDEDAKESGEKKLEPIAEETSGADSATTSATTSDVAVSPPAPPADEATAEEK